MTKVATIATVLAAVLTLAACSTGPAQSESITKGDATFTKAQTK